MSAVKVGLIGCGLMGKEMASALGRWFVLQDYEIQPHLVAVCDPSKAAREWFRRVPTVRHFTENYKELLEQDLDVVYAAVPHHLHEEIYTAALAAGKDLLAEKPFGIDMAAASRILQAVEKSGRFVRCSSEFPFYAGVHRLLCYLGDHDFGRILEINAGFLHSSDLDPAKPANWKRQERTCGKIGVMGDLGLHVLHIPLRMGWFPNAVHAVLQKGYPTRPDGNGGAAICDTWDNATLLTTVEIADHQVPMRLEMKRMAPGQTNTWFLEVLGTDRGVRFSSHEPKAFWTFTRRNEQQWARVDVGHSSVFKTITGSIFEAGFPDAFLQMLAAFFAERAGLLGNRFGCATPEEAVHSHRVFDAALTAFAGGRV